MEATFYQARSGKIYMKFEWVDDKYTTHCRQTDLLDLQVANLLPVIMNDIDFSDTSQFDLNQYQSAYGGIAAEILYDTLYKQYGIEPESMIKQRIMNFRATAKSLADSAAAEKVKLTDLNLSTRAFNILHKSLKAPDNETAADALVNIPSLASVRRCGIQSITEIINAFYRAGVPCKHWINEVRNEKYFIENFIGELEEES